ncbi:tRNA methyltransferase [Candidatus Saccharibacteria bacterium]|nr:MAG: tRNA methyltransferase [Candidatus Saccharibacteria bacterium]
MRSLIVIAHDIRSCHNIGSLLRTAEGLGVERVLFSGYTPFPSLPDDGRLPHIRRKIDAAIHKTALGAETLVSWSHHPDIMPALAELRRNDYHIVGLEQHANSILLPDYAPPDKLALLIGREVEGLDDRLISECDTLLEIPMLGQKESYNVVQATAMALYHCRWPAPTAP